MPAAHPGGSVGGEGSGGDGGQAAAVTPELARDRLGIADEHLVPYVHYKAKLALDHIATLQERPEGKLILVTAISPTPAGVGKTTTSVGPGDALCRIGKKTMIALRQPSCRRPNISTSTTTAISSA